MTETEQTSTTKTDRRPDCVTEIRMGNSVLKMCIRDSLNCGGDDFAVACMRANLRYEKNQKREDVKSHHYRCV